MYTLMPQTVTGDIFTDDLSSGYIYTDDSSKAKKKKKGKTKQK